MVLVNWFCGMLARLDLKKKKGQAPAHRFAKRRVTVALRRGKVTQSTLLAIYVTVTRIWLANTTKTVHSIVVARLADGTIIVDGAFATTLKIKRNERFYVMIMIVL